MGAAVDGAPQGALGDGSGLAPGRHCTRLEALGAAPGCAAASPSARHAQPTPEHAWLKQLVRYARDLEAVELRIAHGT